MAAQSETLTPPPRNWRKLQFGLLAPLLGAVAGILAYGAIGDFTLMVVLVALIVVLAAVVRLELGLLALVFLSYTRFSDVAIEFHGAPSVAKFFVFVLLLGLAFRWAVHGEKPEGWQRPAILLTSYGVLTFASVLYAVDQERAWLFAGDFLKDALIAITIVVLLRRGNTLRWVIWTLLLAGLFLSSITTFQYVTGSFQSNFWGFAQAPVLHIAGEIDSQRVAGPIGDPNFYAQIMVALVPLALDRVWNERNLLLRLVAMIVFGLTSLTVILTFSRGGFLALVFVVVAMFIYRPPRRLVLGLTLALFLALIPLVPKEFVTRLYTLTDLVTGENSTGVVEPSFRGRTSELMVGWRMFTDHPILGVGVGNYKEYYLDYSRRLGMDPRLEERSAHNLFLEVAAETGMVGLAVFGFLLLEVFLGLRNGWRRLMAVGRTGLANMAAAVGISLAGYLAAAMFIHNAYPRYLWLLLGIALAIPNVARWAEQVGPRRVSGNALMLREQSGEDEEIFDEPE